MTRMPEVVEMDVVAPAHSAAMTKVTANRTDGFRAPAFAMAMTPDAPRNEASHPKGAKVRVGLKHANRRERKRVLPQREWTASYSK